jgi:hypothetical protein
MVILESPMVQLDYNISILNPTWKTVEILVNTPDSLKAVIDIVFS